MWTQTSFVQFNIINVTSSTFMFHMAAFSFFLYWLYWVVNVFPLVYFLMVNRPVAGCATWFQYDRYFLLLLPKILFYVSSFIMVLCMNCAAVPLWSKSVQNMNIKVPRHCIMCFCVLLLGYLCSVFSHSSAEVKTLSVVASNLSLKRGDGSLLLRSCVIEL